MIKPRECLHISGQKVQQQTCVHKPGQIITKHHKTQPSIQKHYKASQNTTKHLKTSQSIKNTTKHSKTQSSLKHRPKLMFCLFAYVSLNSVSFR